jgi:hypothetical protein
MDINSAVNLINEFGSGMAIIHCGLSMFRTEYVHAQTSGVDDKFPQLDLIGPDNVHTTLCIHYPKGTDSVVMSFNDGTTSLIVRADGCDVHFPLEGADS